MEEAAIIILIKVLIMFKLKCKIEIINQVREYKEQGLVMTIETTINLKLDRLC